jgi:subtilase family serine protease
MQVARHYGLDEVYALGWTGKGQTIVLIDPGFSPTIQADAYAFNQAMGLPELNSSNFQIIQPDGPQEIPGFASTEVSLDIEWAHALAPDANIVLLAPKNATDPEIAFAIDYAVTHQLGNVISDSFGTPEVFETVATAQMYNTVIEKAAAQGIAFNAITQDHGDSNLGTPVGAAVVPADSPFATAVGGTSIDVPTEDGLVDTAWGTVLTALVSSPGSTGTLPLLSMASSPAPETPLSSLRPLPVFGGGGGESNFFDKPAYQKKLPGTGRQTPDVSAIADGFTGVIIAVPNISIDPTTGVESVNGSEFVGAGGTSLAAPVFSAIWALANQAAREPLGQAAPIIARLPSFALTDILPIVVRPKDNTSGSITVTDPTTSTSSTTSYDPAQLLGLEKSQPQGFVGFLSPMNVDPESGPLNDLGFGADTSLRATVGWDNATGWGEPKGLAFILAARALAKGGY